MLAGLVALFVLIPFVIFGYMKIYDKLLLPRIQIFFDEAQLRNSSVALDMLREKVRASAWSTSIIIMSVLTYIFASVLLENVRLSPFVFMIFGTIFLIIMGDQALLAYRIEKG